MKTLILCQVSPPITTYSTIKDIIIPLLSLVTTAFIGIIIARSLKNREERSKIKMLLIDNYMEYLNKLVAFVDGEVNEFNARILGVLSNNYDHYFGPDANSHIPQKIIDKTIKKLNDKIDKIDRDATNWSPYTFKFCFLLGTKKYNKYAQPLESAFAKTLIADNARQSLVDEIMKKIIGNEKIRAGMNSLNEKVIEDTISSIQLLTAMTYNNWQRKLIEPYSNKIADLISEY